LIIHFLFKCKIKHFFLSIQRRYVLNCTHSVNTKCHKNWQGMQLSKHSVCMLLCYYKLDTKNDTAIPINSIIIHKQFIPYNNIVLLHILYNYQSISYTIKICLLCHWHIIKETWLSLKLHASWFMQIFI
jgi:hypothetical protein